MMRFGATAVFEQTVPSVLTDIVEGPNLAVVAADGEDRLIRGITGDVVARFRQVAVVGEVVAAGEPLAPEYRRQRNVGLL